MTCTLGEPCFAIVQIVRTTDCSATETAVQDSRLVSRLWISHVREGTLIWYLRIQRPLSKCTPFPDRFVRRFALITIVSTH